MTKPNSQLKYDVAIVGGGMVGMAAALTLSQLNLNIVLIENIESQNQTHPSYDDRTLVVNRASIEFWKNIKIWQNLIGDITPINKVHVSNKGHFGQVIFNAKDMKVDALAFIVEAKKLGCTLKKRVKSDANVTLLCPALVNGIDCEKHQVTIDLNIHDENIKLTCGLLLAADGARSAIRQQLQFETLVKSYNRTAIICNITPELKHNNCAYERLTKTGPTAMLPFVENRCGFVWTLENDKAIDVLKLSNNAFIKQAQAQFGYRVGKFLKVGKRSSYPLYLIKVPTQVKSRVILLGNAAHSMSPVSAQGLNLAVRDVAMLFDVIERALKIKQDIGSDETLNQYQKHIETDQYQTMKYTDDLMSWFKIDETIVSLIRSFGLVILDQATTAKQALFSRASGYRGNSPKLLRSQ